MTVWKINIDILEIKKRKVHKKLTRNIHLAIVITNAFFNRNLINRIDGEL